MTINHQFDDSRDTEDWLLPSVPKMLLRAVSRIQDNGALLSAEFKDVGTELERLQCEKEVAIGHQDWEHAAALRDQAVLLKDRVRRACPEAIEIQPEHILQAIARLGYDQPIAV